MIVPATIADLPRMEAAALRFYSSSRWLRKFELQRFINLWTTLLGNGTGVIFLLEEHGVILGAIGGVAYPEAYSDELLAQEFFWFIEEEHRGGGLALYRCFERWAREKGCDEIRMVHLSDSMPDKVAAFYQRMGYGKVETLYSKRLKAPELRKAG